MDWMQALSAHYRQMRERFPNDRLILLFDIDGTLFDPRFTQRHLRYCRPQLVCVMKFGLAAAGTDLIS